MENWSKGVMGRIPSVFQWFVLNSLFTKTPAPLAAGRLPAAARAQRVAWQAQASDAALEQRLAVLQHSI